MIMCEADDESDRLERTRKINSMVSLLIVVDGIPTLKDKEEHYPALEKQLKALSNYDLAEVAQGLGKRTMAICLMMELVGKQQPIHKTTHNSFLFLLMLVAVIGTIVCFGYSKG